MDKNIVIFYVPGAYGSYIAWIIERFNTQRKQFSPAIVDNPLQSDGSAHAHASYCKVENMRSVTEFLSNQEFPEWGYKIWAGWPVDEHNTLDQCIEQTLEQMNNDDRLIVVSRDTIMGAGISWLNASTKLTKQRWYDSLDISSDDELVDAFAQELSQRHFNYVNDRKFIDVSINELLFARPESLLMVVKLLGFDICDKPLFTEVSVAQRKAQSSVTIMKDILSGKHNDSVDPAVASIVSYIKE
tara:strand:+ start:883 stop:1611 length:729 start_codon:yes stop_codon:yes gene_type:complete